MLPAYDIAIPKRVGICPPKQALSQGKKPETYHVRTATEADDTSVYISMQQSSYIITTPERFQGINRTERIPRVDPDTAIESGCSKPESGLDILSE